MCFGCLKEPSHRDGSLSTHNICFGLEIKKNVQLRTLIWGPDHWITHKVLSVCYKPRRIYVHFRLNMVSDF